jgi:hypothetical protein
MADIFPSSYLLKFSISHSCYGSSSYVRNKIISENVTLLFCGCGEVQASITAFRHGIRSEIYYDDEELQ